MAAPAPGKRATLLAAAACGTVLALLVGIPSAHAATDPSSTFGDCRKFNVDSRKGGAKFPKGGAGTINLVDVIITGEGCDMEIRANSLSTTSLDFNDSNWTLDGNVRIRSDEQQSKLSSDRAVVQFRNSEIQRITMTGEPAQFEQRNPDSGLITRGHAREMVYEAGAGTVRLVGSAVENAWISDGSREIQTPQLVYDIRRAEIRSTGGDSADGGKGGSGANDRVRITIDPRASKGPAKDDARKPAPAPSTGENDASSGTSPSPAKP